MGIMMTAPEPGQPKAHDIAKGLCSGCPDRNIEEPQTHGLSCEAAKRCLISEREIRAYELTKARALAASVMDTLLTPGPQSPAPPSYEVYAAVGGAKPKPTRVKFHGKELEGVRRVSIDMGKPGAALLTVVIELPGDAFVQVKGAQYDWRSNRDTPKG